MSDVPVVVLAWKEFQRMPWITKLHAGILTSQNPSAVDEFVAASKRLGEAVL
jgi:hypothetical protein